MNRKWRAHHTLDWRTSPFVRSLTLECRAAYLELLDIAWEEGGLKTKWIDDGTYLAFQIGVSRRKFATIWRSIRERFEEISPGIWSNLRLENERKTAELLSEKQRNRARSLNRKPAAAKQEIITTHHQAAQPLTLTLTNTITNTKETDTDSDRKKLCPAPPTLPFSVDQALGFIAESGRFEATPANTGQAINLTKLIKQHPNPSDWRLVGEWLAAGGDGFKETLDTRSSGDFKHWITHAKKWEEKGKPVLSKFQKPNFSHQTPRPAIQGKGGYIKL